MKLRLLLLAGSATINLAFAAAFILRPSLAPAGVRHVFHLGERGPQTGPSPDATPRKAAAAAPSAPLWSAFATDDLGTLVARLRSAGFPPIVVRAIVDAEIERRFSARMKALTRGLEDTPYWKPDPSYFTGNSKLFEEVSQIYRERSRLLRDLLGKDSLAYGMGDPTELQRRQFGNLSQAKVDLVQRITDDYAEMSSQVRAAMQGVQLPEDREKLAFLEKEKVADLAAVLTPEELAEYQMRSSAVTSRLRTAMSILDASESEFRRIYEIQQPYADLLYPTSPLFYTSDTGEKRRDALATINAQIKQQLGEERALQYQRATNNEFQQLYRIGQRDGIAFDSLVRAYDARTIAADASQKIYNDRSLSADQRRAALQELAQTTRTQILSTLGPNAGPTYVENSRWLRHIEGGGAITITPDGNMVYRSPPPTSSTAPRKQP